MGDRKAVLEVDGTISIVPESVETIRTKRRIKTRPAVMRSTALNNPKRLM